MVERVSATDRRLGPTLPYAILGCFFVVTLVVLGGYAIFGRHPERIPAVPGSAAFYGLALRLLPALHISVAAITLAIALTVWAQRQWLAPFAIVYALSLGSELLGTGVGIPFGAYHYSPLLGLAWSGRVPIVIPLSWFTMAVPAYAIARATVSRGTKYRLVMTAALWLVLWDLSLDPAMSRATAYWGWASSGAYYGMPWSNLLGWFATSLLLMIALWHLRADRWIARVPLRWVVTYYVTVLLLPLGICAAAGLWLPIAFTAVCGALFTAGGAWRGTSFGSVARLSDRELANASDALEGTP